MKDFSSEFKFDTNILVFYVNGKRVEESSVDARLTLAVYLRDYCKKKKNLILAISFSIFLSESLNFI